MCVSLSNRDHQGNQEFQEMKETSGLRSESKLRHKCAGTKLRSTNMKTLNLIYSIPKGKLLFSLHYMLVTAAVTTYFSDNEILNYNTL